MTVWALWFGVYEPSLMGLYTTKEKAEEERLKTAVNGVISDYYYIVEEEVEE